MFPFVIGFQWTSVVIGRAYESAVGDISERYAAHKKRYAELRGGGKRASAVSTSAPAPNPGKAR